MKKSEEEMEQEECERLEEEILKIMRDNYPSEEFIVYEHPPFKKPDETTEYRLQVKRRDGGLGTWLPIDKLRGARPTRIDAWRRLLKVVENAHGMGTRPNSN